MKNTKWIAWNSFLGVIVAFGLYAYYLQIVEGPIHSGTTDTVPWGIHIAAFAFFVGASAGATIIGLMIQAFGRDDYEPLGIRAILVGLLSLAISMAFIISDVGNPLLVGFVPWVFMNTSSPFFYTSASYYVFGAILIAELYYGMKVMFGKANNREKKAAKWLAILAVPFALVIVHAPHGSLFSFMVAREFWNTPLLPPHFAIAALATGTAIMILIAIVTSKFKKKEIVNKETLNHMGILLASFISITVFLDLFDILTLIYSGTTEGMEAWHLLTGEHLPLFILNLSGLVGALLILFFKKGRTGKGLALASFLTIIAIAAYRYNLVVVGMRVPQFHGHEPATYYPSGHDMVMTISLIALIFLLYSVLTKILPLEAKSE